MHANDLLLFSQIIELGSFKRAAEVNNLTSSVVSKRIAKLEKSLNVQLLYRSTRKLSLTEAGEKLCKNANIVRQITLEAVDEIKNDNDILSGHIKMSVPTISGDLLLAESVVEFCEKHPNVTVDMSLENRFVDPIKEGFDLVIRTGALEDSSLIARHIIDSQWVVCCSARYLARFGSPKALSELSNHNCFIYAYQANGANVWQFEQNAQLLSIKVSGSFSTDNAVALRKAALAGHGIIYVPKCLVHNDIENGDLVSLFSQNVAKRLGVYAIHPFVKKTPKKISSLIEHVKQAYLKNAHYF